MRIWVFYRERAKRAPAARQRSEAGAFLPDHPRRCGGQGTPAAARRPRTSPAEAFRFHGAIFPHRGRESPAGRPAARPQRQIRQDMTPGAGQISTRPQVLERRPVTRKKSQYSNTKREEGEGQRPEGRASDIQPAPSAARALMFFPTWTGTNCNYTTL